MPYPPTVTVPQANQEHFYSLGDIRNIFIRVLNSDRGKVLSHRHLLRLFDWDVDSNVQFQENNIVIQSHISVIGELGSTHYFLYHTGFSLHEQNGQPSVSLSWVELESLRVPNEDLREFQELFQSSLQQEMQEDLQYSTIESIQHVENGVQVIYR